MCLYVHIYIISYVHLSMSPLIFLSRNEKLNKKCATNLSLHQYRNRFTDQYFNYDIEKIQSIFGE